MEEDSTRKSEVGRRYSALVRRQLAIRGAILAAVVVALIPLVWWLSQDSYEAVSRTPGTLRAIVESPEMPYGEPAYPWVVLVELDTGREVRVRFAPVPRIGSRICVETLRRGNATRYAFAGFLDNLEAQGQNCSL